MCLFSWGLCETSFAVAKLLNPQVINAYMKFSFTGILQTCGLPLTADELFLICAGVKDIRYYLT